MDDKCAPLGGDNAQDGSITFTGTLDGTTEPGARLRGSLETKYLSGSLRGEFDAVVCTAEQMKAISAQWLRDCPSK